MGIIDRDYMKESNNKKKILLRKRFKFNLKKFIQLLKFWIWRIVHNK